MIVFDILAFILIIISEIIIFYNMDDKDDDYYYYVKAIPKIYVAERDVNVQTITESTKKVGDDE
jgi:hypothetical protein